MTYRTRRLLFFMSIAAFLLLSGPLVLYTLGYRFSLSDLSYRQTGGIFVHATPAGAHVTVDAASRTTSFLTGNAFIQNLQPERHTVRVSREGYQPWEKTIMIQSQTVADISPILMPRRPVAAALGTASSSNMSASPRASLLILRHMQRTQQTHTVFDTTLQQVLPFADTASHTLASSIPNEATWYWNQAETQAIIETPNDWLLLERMENEIRVRSLYRQNALAKLLPKKPRLVARNPEDPNIFFLLDGTNFTRWNATMNTAQQLLQSIASFSIQDDHLLLWDTQSGLPYVTTLDAANARPYATSSVARVTSGRMDEIHTNLLLRSNAGMWIISTDGKQHLLTNTYDPDQVVFTDAYILWWDKQAIMIYWILPETDLPTFQKERQEKIYTSASSIRNAAPYPDENYLVIQEENTLYTLELDGRGGTRNKQVIYKGDNPTFHIPPDEKVIYVLDKGSVFTVELP